MNLLDATGAKRHFSFDKRKAVLFCPQCWSERPKYDSEQRDYAQRQKNGTIACAACLAIYPSKAAYDAECGGWYDEIDSEG